MSDDAKDRVHGCRCGLRVHERVRLAFECDAADHHQLEHRQCTVQGLLRWSSQSAYALIRPEFPIIPQTTFNVSLGIIELQVHDAEYVIASRQYCLTYP